MSQNWTMATVIVAAANQKMAQEFNPDCTGCFISPASADGNEPASHYFTNGMWDNKTLADLVNYKQAGVFVVQFGQDWAAALAEEGLVHIVPAEPA